jgi:hypothetical protein
MTYPNLATWMEPFQNLETYTEWILMRIDARVGRGTFIKHWDGSLSSREYSARESDKGVTVIIINQ